VGRKKIKGAKKPGQLGPGLCRFSFIADEKLINQVKEVCRVNDQYIKDFMGDAIKEQLKKVVIKKKTGMTVNIGKLKEYLAKAKEEKKNQK
jgi:hypothetical protein